MRLTSSMPARYQAVIDAKDESTSYKWYFKYYTGDFNQIKLGHLKIPNSISLVNRTEIFTYKLKLADFSYTNLESCSNNLDKLDDGDAHHRSIGIP